MLEIVPMAQPPAGSVTPAHLYVDRASKQLWLGVSTSVDPTGSVLVSDIVAMLAGIDAAEVDAKAYTDTQILTRAPSSHTHPSSQITDFNAAVDARIAESPSTGALIGSVSLYAGLLADVGAGDLVDYAVCDGRSLLRATYPELFAKLGTIWGSVDGTHFNIPNLVDKFVYGAGNIATGVVNVAANLAIPLGGSHSHGGNTSATTLTIAHMPVHDHSIPALTGTAASAGAHNHTQSAGAVTRTPASNNAGSCVAQQSSDTSTDGAHTHTVTTVANTTGDRGSGSGHSHPIVSDPGHTHTVTAVSNSVRNALNYAVIAYIIKLS
jgi:microcystin-dependent protein